MRYNMPLFLYSLLILAVVAIEPKVGNSKAWGGLPSTSVADQTNGAPNRLIPEDPSLVPSAGATQQQGPNWGHSNPSTRKLPPIEDTPIYGGPEREVYNYDPPNKVIGRAPMPQDVDDSPSSAYGYPQGASAGNSGGALAPKAASMPSAGNPNSAAQPGTNPPPYQDDSTHQVASGPPSTTNDSAPNGSTYSNYPSQPGEVSSHSSNADSGGNTLNNNPTYGPVQRARTPFRVPPNTRYSLPPSSGASNSAGQRVNATPSASQNGYGYAATAGVNGYASNSQSPAGTAQPAQPSTPQDNNYRAQANPNQTHNHSGGSDNQAATKPRRSPEEQEAYDARIDFLAQTLTVKQLIDNTGPNQLDEETRADVLNKKIADLKSQKDQVNSKLEQLSAGNQAEKKHLQQLNKDNNLSQQKQKDVFELRQEAFKDRKSSDNRDAPEMYMSALNFLVLGNLDAAKEVLTNFLEEYQPTRGNTKVKFDQFTMKSNYWLGRVSGINHDYKSAQQYFQESYRMSNYGQLSLRSLVGLAEALTNLRDHEDACLVVAQFDAEYQKISADPTFIFPPSYVQEMESFRKLNYCR